MRVIAIKPGFIGGARRRVGDEFEIPDDQLEHEPVTGMPVIPRWCHSAEDPRGAQRRIVNYQTEFARAVEASGPQRGDEK